MPRRARWPASSFSASAASRAGLTIYAPALVLSVILGWPERITTIMMGATVVTYTVLGGIKAVTWSDVQQMCIIFAGLVISLVTVILLLPASVSFGDAVFLAGAAGRLNAVTTNFDWNDRFNIWSGLIGGTFLFLSYFGCDQSQVQRYLTGKSIAQSRLSLLFNAVAKIPMQFFILFIGAMVFVFYLFVQPPVLFQQVELKRIAKLGEYQPVSEQYQQRVRASQAGGAGAGGGASRGRCARARTGRRPSTARRRRNSTPCVPAPPNWWRARAARRVSATPITSFCRSSPGICLSGIVGLVIAVIFAATMSASSGEINSLATVTVIDIYQRHFKRDASDQHYLWASRWFTLFWGVYAVVFAGWAKRLGSLIVAVNKVGSLFYGSLLGLLRAGVPLPAGCAARPCSAGCWPARRPSSPPLILRMFPGSGTT